MKLEDVLCRINVNHNDIIALYHYGSYVYGTHKKGVSDFDFICVLKNNVECKESYSDNLVDITFFTLDRFIERLNDHEISALECLYLESEFKLIDSFDFSKVFKLDLIKLRHSISSKSSNSFVKAKKKLTIPESYDRYIGVKSLYHSLRIVLFGIQIAEKKEIVNYSEANYLYYDIVYSNTWKELFDKYKTVHNNLMTQFRMLAPKE